MVSDEQLQANETKGSITIDDISLFCLILPLMALRIGLTGGIGSGKSTVAKVFEVLGIPVYYADEAARHIMNADPHLRNRSSNTSGPAPTIMALLN